MQLLLMRHGEAVEERVDIRRPLSDQGLADVKMMARFLKQGRFPIMNFFHSTKERARQTADIVRQAVNPAAVLVEKNYLAPMDTLDQGIKQIGQLTVDTLIVGHMPFLSNLVSWLVTGEETKEIVSFPAGAVVVLTPSSAGRWVITTAVSPAHLSGKG